MARLLTRGPHVARFLENYCTLNGSYAGLPFKPLGWMRDDLNTLYEIDETTHKRVVRTGLLGVPRKSSKSTLGAGLCAYHLIFDQADDHPQVWGAAGDRKQAKIVFNFTKELIEASPDLRRECKIYRDVIECKTNGGTYQVASADAGLAHGTNPSFTLFDEMHVQKRFDLYTALRTGSAQRNQPLTLIITTAGYDLETPLGFFYRKGLRVNNGEEIDPTFWMKWYGPKLDEQFNPKDESRWPEWMPSWEIMNQDEIRTASRELPEAEFIRFHLNGWTTQKENWLPHGAWDKCEDQTKSITPGDPVVFGFDGAFAGDCTALMACRTTDLHLEPLAVWERPPNDNDWRTPRHEVRQAIRDACDKYKPFEVACDPYLFQSDIQDLEEDGYPMVEFPTIGGRMVSPTKMFYDAVLDGELSHNGDPQLARHVTNTRLKQDDRGSRIAKESKSSTRHIDMTVASVIAVARAQLFREEVKPEPKILIF